MSLLPASALCGKRRPTNGKKVSFFIFRPAGQTLFPAISWVWAWVVNKQSGAVMLSVYIAGLATGAGLIIAIGAQNAYVLVESLRRNHHFLLAGICALIDIALIAAGVLGIGTLVASSQVLRIGASLGGAAFLLWFGAGSFRAIFKQESLQTSPGGQPKSLKKTVLGLLAVSLLNPHVYLDTMIMLGAISGSYPGNGRYVFGLGACTASLLWFFSLAFCGERLAPVFARPRSWQILNGFVALMVWSIALKLLWDVWKDF